MDYSTKIRCSLLAFLWKGSENASGRQCLVKWQKVMTPEDLGRLGILKINRFDRALWLGGLWLDWAKSLIGLRVVHISRVITQTNH